MRGPKKPAKFLRCEILGFNKDLNTYKSFKMIVRKVEDTHFFVLDKSTQNTLIGIFQKKNPIKISLT